MLIGYLLGANNAYSIPWEDPEHSATDTWVNYAGRYAGVKFSGLLSAEQLAAGSFFSPLFVPINAIRQDLMRSYASQVNPLTYSLICDEGSLCLKRKGPLTDSDVWSK